MERIFCLITKAFSENRSNFKSTTALAAGKFLHEASKHTSKFKNLTQRVSTGQHCTKCSVEKLLRKVAGSRRIVSTKERETACVRGAGPAAENRQVPLRTDEPERQKEKDEEMRCQSCKKEEVHMEGRNKKREGRRRAGMAANWRRRLWKWFGGEWVGSLLLGNECAAVEVSVYFCRLSFQGPDWQLFLELESHSLLNWLSREEEEGAHWHARTTAHAHEQTTHVTTHTYAHSMWRHAHTPSCSHVHSLVKHKCHTHTFTFKHTHLCLKQRVARRCCEANTSVCMNTVAEALRRTTMHEHSDTFMEVLCGMCYCSVCMCERGMVKDLH